MSDLSQIHVEQWGNSGPRALLVHGGTQGTQAAGDRNFYAQRPLGDEWQVVVPDRPGHGKSADPGRPDDAQEDAIWVAELLKDGSHLLGHSYGGLVAVAAAARRPEAVKSLTLIEPALFAVATKPAAVKKLLATMVFTMVMPFSPVSRAKRMMKLLGIPNVFALSTEELNALGRSLKRGVFPKPPVIEGWLTTIREAKIPVLIVSSGSNAAFEAMGGIVAKKLSGRHEIIPIKHHFPQWNAAPFNRLVSTFWRQTERSKSR